MAEENPNIKVFATPEDDSDYLVALVFYPGIDGSSMNFAKELMESGTTDKIRAMEGCKRQEYFQSIADPELIVLLDSWDNAENKEKYRYSDNVGAVVGAAQKFNISMNAEEYTGKTSPVVFYKGKDGAARKFAEELIADGVDKAMREEPGCMHYEYYQSLDDPETVMLLDAWKDKESENLHHQSPNMPKVFELRAKYDLAMEVERYANIGFPSMPGGDPGGPGGPGGMPPMGAGGPPAGFPGGFDGVPPFMKGE